VSAQIPEGLEPFAAWDAKNRPPGWTDGHTQQMLRWIRQHLPEDARHIYRIEFYLPDGPFAPLAVLYCFARDEDGRKYQDTTGEPAVEPPSVVPLGELPPAHLLARA